MISKIIKDHYSILKNIITYFSASLIPMGLSLISNPLIAANMAPEDYAIVGYYNSLNNLISPMILFYMVNYYTKRYFELNSENREKLKSTLLKALIYFSFIIAIFGLIILLIYMIFFNKNSYIPFYPYAFLSVLALPLTGISILMLTDYKMSQNSKAFFNLSIIQSLITVSIVLLLVVIFKQGAIGRIGATFIANAIIFLWCLYKNWHIFNLKFDFIEFKTMLNFCWPLTIAAMLGFFSSGYDLVFLERIGNAKELGYYVVAVQIASYITIFSTAVNSTFQPDIYESIVKKNYKNTSKYIFINVVFVTIVVLFFILLAPYIVYILTAGRYVYSTEFSKILALASITSVMYYAISQVTIALGYTTITLINKILGSIASIIMFRYFINRWEFIGAAWGQVISYLIFFIGNIILISIFSYHKKCKCRV